MHPCTCLVLPAPLASALLLPEEGIRALRTAREKLEVSGHICHSHHLQSPSVGTSSSSRGSQSVYVPTGSRQGLQPWYYPAICSFQDPPPVLCRPLELICAALD